MKGACSEQIKSGLGFGAKQVEKTTSSAVGRHAVIKAFEAQEEERQVMKNHRLEHFAEWTKWDDYMDNIATGRG